MPTRIYRWTDDIWSIHVEVENSSNEDSEVSVSFLGSERPGRVLRIPAGETMRFNVARVDEGNDSVELSWSEGVDLRIFENRDRAFYGIAPVEGASTND